MFRGNEPKVAILRCKGTVEGTFDRIGVIILGSPNYFFCEHFPSVYFFVFV